MQTVLVRAVWLGDRSLDRNIFLGAIRNHLGPAGEQGAIFFDAPWSDDLHAWFKSFCGELKTALVVPFARCPVSIGVGTDFASDLQADLGDKRSGDRRPHQVDAFVAGLPLHDGKREIPAEFFLDVHNPGRLGTAGVSLFQDGFTIFTWLPKIDVNTMDVVTFVLQPAKNDRSIQTAGIGENATGHEQIPIHNRANRTNRPAESKCTSMVQ